MLDADIQSLDIEIGQAENDMNQSTCLGKKCHAATYPLSFV